MTLLQLVELAGGVSLGLGVGLALLLAGAWVAEWLDDRADR